MTEDQAKRWLSNNFDVSRETWSQLQNFVDFVIAEAKNQNLISASTLGDVWNRHIVDSAQLVRLINMRERTHWLDLGSGAGFPGIVIAILTGNEVTLVESRTRRIDYLARALQLLDLKSSVTLAGMAVEKLPTAQYSVITARAFAPLRRVFELAGRFSTDKTIWVLPKGKNAVKEWQDAQASWHGDFRIEPSVTDDESGILVGRLFATRQKAL